MERKSLCRESRTSTGETVRSQCFVRNGQIRDFVLTSAFSAPCSCAPKPKEIPTVQEPHEVHTLFILDVRTFVVRQGSLNNYMSGKAMDMVSIRELLCINSKLSPYYLPGRQIHPTRWLFPALKAELEGVTGWFLWLLFFQAPLRRFLSFRQLISIRVFNPKEPNRWAPKK